MTEETPELPAIGSKWTWVTSDEEVVLTVRSVGPGIEMVDSRGTEFNSALDEWAEDIQKGVIKPFSVAGCGFAKGHKRMGQEAKNAGKATGTVEAPRAGTGAKIGEVLTQAQADATEAVWRMAGSQYVKLTREPLVALLTRHIAPGDEGIRARLATFLETEVGTAMLAAFLSLVLGALPPMPGDVPGRLSRELRVRAMGDVGDVLADLLMAPLRLVMFTYLAGAPAPTLQPPAVGTLVPPSPQDIGEAGAATGRALRVAPIGGKGTGA